MTAPCGLEFVRGLLSFRGFPEWDLRYVLHCYADITANLPVRFSVFMSLPAIIGAFFTEIGNFGASEMTAGLGFTYVFAMIIAGFAGCLVIRNTIAMTQNIKLRYFAYYSFIVGIITLALNFAL